MTLTGLNIETDTCQDLIDLSFYNSATSVSDIDPQQVGDDVVVTISDNSNRRSRRSVQADATITITNTQVSQIASDSFVFADAASSPSAGGDSTFSFNSPSGDSSGGNDNSFSFSSASSVSAGAVAYAVVALVAAIAMMI
eukprot:TRINITY_DN452_c0_g1_i4.p3 TRINITY_DN452_c0_g1~~TRINITY_DN452_c0_g1_i4.p3  ORF type:complete len:140 (-),score=54.72 TRINITY_DN452_c0_g1_i4:250-669(-)